MGAVNLIIGGVILIFAVLIFAQPIFILNDQANSVISSKNTVMYGKNSDGIVVPVGNSIFGSDLLLGLLGLIGFCMFIGFIVWSSRGAPEPYEDNGWGGV